MLTSNERSKVAAATTAYNNAIVSIATTNDLAIADMNAILNQLVSGLRIETGQLYTANYFSGPTNEGSVLFSLDGVHPNARGYAVITNEIITADKNARLNVQLYVDEITVKTDSFPTLLENWNENSRNLKDSMESLFKTIL